LSIAQQQMVEIAKALSLNARLIIMDEPTSSLTLTETKRLLELVCELSGQGVSIAYISHRLGEIEECADRVVVLRDGKNAGELTHEEATHDKLVSLMVGREIKNFYVEQSPQRHVIIASRKIGFIRCGARRDSRFRRPRWGRAVGDGQGHFGIGRIACDRDCARWKSTFHRQTTRRD
jgi:ABC-type sugar transport system ATPase subunit